MSTVLTTLLSIGIFPPPLRMLQAVECQEVLAHLASRKTNIIGVLFHGASCVYTKGTSTLRSLLLNCSTLCVFQLEVNITKEKPG